MNIGLIIQGPVISGGFTGLTHGSGRTRANKNSLIKFDSASSINLNISIAKEYFNEIVVSTWDNQDTQGIQGNCKIIKSMDPTPNPPETRKPIDDFPDFNKINKVRQFYSVHQGLNYLEKLGIEHAIKIRTDQTLNIERLFNDYSDFCQAKDKKFMVPFLTDDEPWSIPDFYIGGKVSDFKELALLMIDKKLQFHTNVHRDLFFKAAFLNRKLFEEIFLSDYFILRDIETIKLSNIREISLNKIWSPASKELYESVVWRGDPIVNRPKPKKIFLGEKPNLEPVRNSKVNVDWNLFLRSTTGNGSIIKFNIYYILYKQNKLYRNIRSSISGTLDKYSLRTVFHRFKILRLKFPKK